jgi:hypothetical protein
VIFEQPSKHAVRQRVQLHHQRGLLDRDAAPLAQAVAENPRWENNGWEICDYYQRFFIQGSHVGTLRNCRFTRIGSGKLPLKPQPLSLRPFASILLPWFAAACPFTNHAQTHPRHRPPRRTADHASGCW